MRPLKHLQRPVRPQVPPHRLLHHHQLLLNPVVLLPPPLVGVSLLRSTRALTLPKVCWGVCSTIFHIPILLFKKRLNNSERQTSCILGELGVSSPFLFKISGFNTDRIIRIEEGIKRPDDSQEPRTKRVQCCEGC